MGIIEKRIDLDHQYMSMMEDISFRPIFVMGDHRTGTTILYKILGATECFNIVTAYHIIKYNEITHNYVNQSVDHCKNQLVMLFIEKGLRDRGFDGVSISPDTPEEYGFILKSADPRPQLRPDNLTSLVNLGKKIQLTSDPTRPLLLKNPWDYFLNFMYVKEAFPNSKFIFIHRHPVDTINSQLRAVRSLFRTKNEYVALVADWYDQVFRQPLRLQIMRGLLSSHFGIGLRIVTRHVAKATAYFLQHVSFLPQEDYLCVRYEDLCQSPRSTVMKILDSLDLKENVTTDYKSFIDVRSGFLLKEVERNRESIYRRMKPYFEYCGYKLEDRFA